MWGDKEVKGPDDYQNHYHTTDDGKVWVDKKGKLIPLSKALTEQEKLSCSTISPQDLWEARQTRHGIHAPIATETKKEMSSTKVDSSAGDPNLNLSPIKASEDMPTPEQREVLEKARNDLMVIAEKMVMGASYSSIELVTENVVHLMKKLRSGTLESPSKSDQGDEDGISLKTLESQLEDSQSNIKMLEAKLIDAEAEIKRLNSDTDTESLRTRLKEVDTELSRLVGKDKVKDTEIHSLKSKIKNAEMEKSKTANELICLKEELHKNHASLAQTKGLLEQIELEKVTLRKELSNLREAQIKIERLEEEKTKLEQHISDLGNPNDTIFRLEEENKNLYGRIKQQADSQATLDSVLNNNTELRAKVARLQQELDSKPKPRFNTSSSLNASDNSEIIESLSQSLMTQARMAKQQVFFQAKGYDGKSHEGLIEWFDEVEKLVSHNDTTYLEAASMTAKGTVLTYIKELKAMGKHWDEIKLKLRERYSGCNSAAAAQSKLKTIKQNGRPMHEYIDHFKQLLEHAYKTKASDSSTGLLATIFIDGIDETKKYLRFKLRSDIGAGHSLKWFFDQAQDLEYKQDVRSIDFGTEDKASTEINAIKYNNNCFRCNSPDHLVKDCQLPDPREQKSNTRPNQGKIDFDKLCETLNNFASSLQASCQTMLKTHPVNQSSNNRQSNHSYNNKQPRSNNSYQKSNGNYQRNNSKQYGQRNSSHRQVAHTNAIEEFDASDYESEAGDAEEMGTQTGDFETESKI